LLQRIFVPNYFQLLKNNNILSTKVSIIVPNYNHQIYLQKRLDSIFNQTFEDFEVILLDDASNDGSRDILNLYENHPKVSHLIINNENSGSPFKQWKKGIELSQGEYIWIAESDDFCETTFLEHLLKKINERIGICFSQTIDVDENGKLLLNRIDYTNDFNPNIWKDDFEISGIKFIEKYLLVKNVIPNASAVIFRRSLIDDTFFTNNFLQMRMCGDWFFWIRIALKTEVGFVAEDLNYFRNHSKVSRNHTTLAMRKQRLIEEGIIRSFLGEINLSNSLSEKFYYNKWFQLNRLSSVLKPSFYRGKLSKTATFTFLYNFLFFKLNKL